MGFRVKHWLLYINSCVFDIAAWHGSFSNSRGMVAGDRVCSHFCIHDRVCAAGKDKGGMARKIKREKDNIEILEMIHSSKMLPKLLLQLISFSSRHILNYLVLQF